MKNENVKWYNKKWFTIATLIFFFPLGLYLMWKNKHFSKKTRVIISIAYVLMAVYSFLESGSEMRERDKVAIEQKQDDTKQEEKKEQKVDTNIDATIKTNVSNDAIELIIETNAIDGSEFEYFIMNGDLDMKSGFVSVENGIAKTTVEIDESWEPGYLGIGASMRFNMEDRKQPEHVRKAYGEHGEKLKGDLAQENHLNGYNIFIDGKTVAFPNEEEVKANVTSKLESAMSELVDGSNGVIVSIRPSTSDWKIIRVTVSDAWYYSPEHEKERFAQTFGDGIEKIIKASGIIEKNEIVSVSFYDSYGKELATPKIMGGYKIKR